MPDASADRKPQRPSPKPEDAEAKAGEERKTDGKESSFGLSVLFWAPGPARLRAGWRVLLAALVLFAVLIGTSQGIGALGLSGPGGRLAGHLPFFLATAAMLYAASRLDRRPARAYGFALGRQWWVDFGGGLALGVLMHAGLAAAHYGLGWAQVSGTVETGAFDGPFALAVALVFVQFAGVALWEETLFRGVFILNTAEGFSGWDASPQARVLWAWGASTVVFGGLHLGSNFASSAVFGGTAPRFEDFPAAVRMSTEFPGGWEAAGGLAIPAQVLTLGLVVLWIYARGSLGIAPRLRRAVSRE